VGRAGCREFETFAGLNQRLQEASAEQPLPVSQQAALVSQASQQTPASQQGPLQAQGPPASQAQPAATQGQSSQRQTSQQSQGEVAEATGTAPQRGEDCRKSEHEHRAKNSKLLHGKTPNGNQSNGKDQEMLCPQRLISPAAEGGLASIAAG
jgi:hypothetical protein